MHEQYSHIAIDLIDEDVHNHRLVNDPDADTELEQSIRLNGIQQPVKLNAKGDGRYTLVWGFRRKAAALRAGLTTIPAMVVEGLSTSQIRALQAIENLERKELHPLEEAQFCEDLAETLTAEHQASNTDAELHLSEAIAQRIGRSPKWVESRLAMARLSDRVKQAFIDHDIHLQHVHLIARLASHEAQEEVLGQVAAHIPMYHMGGEDTRTEHKQAPATIATTRNLVEKHLRDLSDVPWLLEAEFGGKEACIGCPHNSANRLELFHDDAPKKPQCLLASCFAEKAKAAGRAIQKASNTALKKSEKPTKAEVAEAMEEREAAFVKTAAVVEATKRKQEPTKTTPREKQGSEQRKVEQQIEREYQEQLRKWEDQTVEAIAKKLPKDPVTLTILIAIYSSDTLLNRTAEADQSTTPAREKENKIAQQSLAKALKQLAPTEDKSAAAAEERLYKGITALKQYITQNPEDLFQNLRWQADSDDHLIPLLAEALKVKTSPPPSRDDIAATITAEAEKDHDQEAA